MNIVCVYSDNESFSTPTKPLTQCNQIAYGLSVIMTLYEKAGHHVELLVFNPKTPMTLLDEALEKYNPKMVCFSSVYTQFNFICEIADRVKNTNPNIYTVLGGAHATLNPDSSIQKSCFDAVCVGEGERAMVRLAEMVEAGEQPSGIHNMCIKKKDGTIEKNPQDDFIQDLDSIPYINRKIWQKWIMDTTGLMTIVVGRGCPFTCTYCSNHALSRVASGRYFRLRSVENVIGELEQIAQDFPRINVIYFEIETLSVDIDYTIHLCEELKKLNERLKRPFIFGTNFTVTRHVIDRIDELSDKMKEANFQYVNTGLESGSYELRTKVLRRPEYRNEDLIRFSKILQEKGIDVYLYILLGIPDETLEDFKLTTKVARACNPKDVYLSIMCPYPGTDLYKYSVKKGYMKETASEGEEQLERRSVFLELPGFSRKQILNQYKFFPYRAFKGVWPRGKVISSVFGYIVCSSTVLSNILQVILRNGLVRKIMEEVWKSKNITRQFDEEEQKAQQ